MLTRDQARRNVQVEVENRNPRGTKISSQGRAGGNRAVKPASQPGTRSTCGTCNARVGMGYKGCWRLRSLGLGHLTSLALRTMEL